MALRLENAGIIEGMVREADGGKGIAHARVIAQFSNGLKNDFRLETETGTDGRYKLEGVPPAAIQRMPYAVMAESPGWADSEWKFVPVVQSGVSSTVDLAMERAAVVAGRVLDTKGGPVAGALVGFDTRGKGWNVPDWRAVETDGQGRFVAGMGNLGNEAPLLIYAAKGGFARVVLGPLNPGEITQKDIQLPGALRVRGIVADEAGKPVRDVAVLVGKAKAATAITGDDGRFDLGQISMTEGMPTVLFRAPRPYRDWGTSYGEAGVTYDPKQWKTPPEFYYHQQMTVKGNAGEAVELKVTMKPTELLTISGMVVDASGRPVEHAGVLLLTGNTAGDDWLGLTGAITADRRPIVPDASVVSLGGSPWTGADGKWTLLAARENGVGMLRGNEKTDWMKYCIGVWAGERHVLVRNVEVPADDKMEMTIRLNGP